MIDEEIKELVTRIKNTIESEILQGIHEEAKSTSNSMEWGAYKTAQAIVMDVFKKYAGE